MANSCIVLVSDVYPSLLGGPSTFNLEFGMNKKFNLGRSMRCSLSGIRQKCFYFSSACVHLMTIDYTCMLQKYSVIYDIVFAIYLSLWVIRLFKEL